MLCVCNRSIWPNIAGRGGGQISKVWAFHGWTQARPTPFTGPASIPLAVTVHGHCSTLAFTLIGYTWVHAFSCTHELQHKASTQIQNQRLRPSISVIYVASIDQKQQMKKKSQQHQSVSNPIQCDVQCQVRNQSCGQALLLRCALSLSSCLLSVIEIDSVLKSFPWLNFHVRSQPEPRLTSLWPDICWLLIEHWNYILYWNDISDVSSWLALVFQYFSSFLWPFLKKHLKQTEHLLRLPAGSEKRDTLLHVKHVFR